MITFKKSLVPKVEDLVDECNLADGDDFAPLKSEWKATIEQPPEINAAVSDHNKPAPSGDFDLIHIIENMKQSDAFTRLDDLAELSEKTFFEIGGVLSMIRKNKWFESCPTFEDWIKTNTVYRVSKARALVQIYDAVLAADLSWTAIKDIGWTKLRAIARVLTKDNAEHWLELANVHGKLELIDQVQQHLCNAGEGSASKAKPATKLAGLKKKLMSLDAIILAETLAEVIGNLDQAAKDQVIQAISSSLNA